MNKHWLIWTLLGAFSLNAHAISVESDVYQAPLQIKSAPIYVRSDHPLELRFSGVLPSKTTAKSLSPKEMLVKSIEVGNSIPASEEWNWALEQLQWQGKGDFIEAFVEFEVTHAPALALSLDWQPEADSRLELYEPQTGKVVHVLDADSPRYQGYLFTDFFEGKRLGMHLIVPKDAEQARHLRVLRLHYLYDSIDTTLKRTNDIGSSFSCHLDINCLGNSAEDQQIAKIKSAVAKVIFSDVKGASLMCTGQLLNIKSDDPKLRANVYMLTAGHCTDGYSTGQDIAANLYWNFDSRRCRNTNVGGDYRVTRGGGKILAHQFDGNVAVGRDFAFLKLHEPPAAGTVLLGWSDALPPVGRSVFGIHHPMGDLKKYSRGKITGYYTQEPGMFSEVTWTYGLTQGGSSGSGIYFYGNDGHPRLYGVLSGGTDSNCRSRQKYDAYTSLHSFFNDIAPYIYPKHKPTGKTLDGSMSGSWYNRNRNGEGVVLEIASNNTILVYWYTYTPNGQQLYLTGSSVFTSGASAVEIPVYATSGARFGAAFDASQVRRTFWGTLTLHSVDCNNLNIDYASTNPAYGKGRLSLRRISSIEGRVCQ